MGNSEEHPALLVLIGQGSVPLIWLAAPSQPNAKTWIYVVKANKVVNPGLEVGWRAETKTMDVIIGGVEVLRVVAHNYERADVQLINLRPLGLDVTGSIAGVQLGTNTFSRNHVVGARVGINISVPDAQLVET